MKRLSVSDLMTRKPITCPAHLSVYDCAKILIKKNIRSLLLVENGGILVGILTEKDIIKSVLKNPKIDFRKVKAIKIATRKLAVVSPSNSIEETIEKMKSLVLDKFPVIHNGKLVGIITSKDILNFNPGIYSEFQEFKKIREEGSKLKRFNLTGEIRRGPCEKCGTDDFLSEVGGMFVCQVCFEEM